jgi:cytidylate kinase
MSSEEIERSGARRLPLVTVAALYGAGVSVVGPGVAERLGVRLLDREVPDDVARRAGVSKDAVADVDDEPRSRMERLFSNVGRAAPLSRADTGSADALDVQERRLRSTIEETLAQAKKSGGVVIGRGGMVVLRAVPWALHVHLGGPRDARIEQAMSLDAIDREAAERRQQAEDRARTRYVRHAYGVDGGDPALYHLTLDSTAIDLDMCVEVIVAASRGRVRKPRETTPT